MAAAIAASLGSSFHDAEDTRRIEYADLPAGVQQRFADEGLNERSFPTYLDSVEAETERRVADGEREHLIYYALQSSRVTARPRIEPAVSARRFVEGLSTADRERLMKDSGFVPAAGWPAAEQERVGAALAAMANNVSDARLSFFKPLVLSGDRMLSVNGLFADYVRVARFLYLKEFVASETAPQVARLYQTRPHSLDTQIEAGYGVYLGLGALHTLALTEPINRVLVVGPGLDLAPRTDLIDLVGPQSYQPFAIADALLSLSISSEQYLRVQSVDVNQHVVSYAQAIARQPVTLHFFTGVSESSTRPFNADYRSYVVGLGRAIGNVFTARGPIASDPRYRHSVAVRPAVRQTMTGDRLNIVTGRLSGNVRFDLAVITNVLPYLDDRQLTLALANVAAMLRPGGFLLHNESRAGLVEIAASVQLPAIHMRTAVIAASERPLYDTVWLHQKART